MFLGGKDQLLVSKMVYLHTGLGKTAFVPRAELAEAGANAIATAAEHANKAYELNGSEKVTFSDIATSLTKITGESIGYISPKVHEFEETMKSFGVPSEYIGMMISFGLGIAAGAFDAPNSDLESLLGRSSMRTSDFLTQVYG
jgi:NAD(P)H dehydrogenase (quinone)